MTSAGEVEGPRDKRRRERLPDTPDPVEIAMAAVASGKPIPDVARKVLEQQALLIRAQVAELRLRHVGEWVRAALWALLALAALAVVGLVAAVVLRAARTDALVVEPFEVPPALAARGMTGKVIATQVLDRLAALQQGSESTRPAASYANNWGDEIKIDIPNTGATTDQVWKLLRGWLGKETRISGEIVETDAGLTLAARVGAVPAERFTGSAAELDALITRAAELIYKETQPYRYALYVRNQPGREAEAEPILRALTRHPSAVERKWAYNGLSVFTRGDGRFEEALAMANRSLAIDKGMVAAANNIGLAFQLMGRDQAMVDAFDRSAALSTKGYDPVVIGANKCRNDADIGQAARDPARLAEASDCLAASSSRIGDIAPYYRGVGALYRHEPARALFPAGSTIQPSTAAFYDRLVGLQAALDAGPRAAIEAALADFRRAEAEETAAEARDPRVRFRVGLARLSRQAPLEAQALAALGRAAEAQALIATTPLDCYLCVRTRGLVAQAAGDMAQADRWFADAVRQGPRLAPAYLDRARLKVTEGRHAEAAALFAQAAKLAPNWADPLKSAGDALAAQGDRTAALAKYAAALKLAPQWGALRAAYGRVGGVS